MEPRWTCRTPPPIEPILASRGPAGGNRLFLNCVWSVFWKPARTVSSPSRTGACKIAEQTLAARVLPSLKRGMLCLADRLFTTYPMWRQAAATGADLLWRGRENLVLPVEEPLPDGSYLSTIYPSPKARRHQTDGIRLRVIEYRLEDHPDKPSFRLLTLLDPRKDPAHDLAELYPERWEIEGAFDELKMHLRGGRVVLRSKTPDLVEQELYGLMLAHRAVRALMWRAAAGRNPDRPSFTRTVRVVRPKLASPSPAFSPCGD